VTSDSGTRSRSGLTDRERHHQALSGSVRALSRAGVNEEESLVKLLGPRSSRVSYAGKSPFRHVPGPRARSGSCRGKLTPQRRGTPTGNPRVLVGVQDVRET
jgi:hypothetical protein